ncbi:hypothetical protein KIN20_013634 [Parelaphostrongylus tenuis]|uniref:Uncharacterized protein n=1 Tax=Parelaphostrongylus tenuis TaxID=148309 RepID=A0AAD5QL61_PARTN|nr:hypothetical protein KIN20_013634 [Parelaphostrongylus tenuis]
MGLVGVNIFATKCTIDDICSRKKQMEIVLRPALTLETRNSNVKTTHINIDLFLFVTGRPSVQIFSTSRNTSSETVYDVLQNAEDFKVFISLSLHIVATVCLAACAIINNIVRVSQLLPPVVVS